MGNKINYAKLYTLRSDGRYQGYYYDERGVRHAVTAKDPKVVYDKIQEKSAPKRRLFADACDAWERVHRDQVTEQTWKNYVPHLAQIRSGYGKLSVEDITAQMIAADLERAKARGYSRTVVNTRRVIWSNVLRSDVVLGYLQFNVCDSVRLPKGLPSSIRHPPEDSDMRKILRNVDDEFGFYPFFLLCSGLRRSEALALTWNDINLQTREISVTKSLEYVYSGPRLKPPKTEAGVRTVPIISVLYDELERRMPRDKTKLLFPAVGSNRAGVGGGYMTKAGYRVAWQHYCERVGLGAVTAHQLRHGTATLLIESGVEPEVAQRILGHTRVSTTIDLYTELRDSKIKKDASKLDAVMASLMADDAESVENT